MGEARHPSRIFATVNGASTRFPDGGRLLIGGWTEDGVRPNAVEYLRGDIAEVMLEALKSARSLIQRERDEISAFKALIGPESAISIEHLYLDQMNDTLREIDAAIAHAEGRADA